MTETQKPRILYLDLDDTILVWSNNILGFGAPRSVDFIHWALEHFEVRWLTMWCPSGKLRSEGAEELSYRLGHTIAPEVFQSIVNPKSFIGYKTEGIDFDDPRPWVWVEDEILPNEKHVLTGKNLFENFYSTNVSKDMTKLQSTWRSLATRFNLPSCTYPYDKKVVYPEIILSNLELHSTFRGNKKNHDAVGD